MTPAMARQMVTRNPILLTLAVAATLLAGCAAAQRQHAAIEKAGEGLSFDLAKLYVNKGVHQAAVPLLQKLLADNPKDERARVLYGTVLRDQGLYPQAEQQLRYALMLEPRDAEAHAALGILFDLERQPRRALAEHEQAVKLAPRVARFRNNLGFSLYLAGDTKTAIAQLEQALALDPGLTVAYGNLGFAYGQLREFDRAERTFRAALPEAGALMNMALVYERHGELEHADELRARAYAIDPDLRGDEVAGLAPGIGPQ